MISKASGMRTHGVVNVIIRQKAKHLTNESVRNRPDTYVFISLSFFQSSEEYVAIAARWFDGLISQNVELSKEVYSLQSVDFDRQVSQIMRLVY